MLLVISYSQHLSFVALRAPPCLPAPANTTNYQQNVGLCVGAAAAEEGEAGTPGGDHEGEDQPAGQNGEDH